ncbi:MAG TPA: hypothetical protein VNR00_08620 [Opitutus sp.]|nr:hypothetical protein [Opitutus sp.]
MSSDENAKPLVYLILGAAGSGRRDVVADLIDGGLAETDRVAVLVSDTEKESAGAASLPRVDYWKWTGEFIEGALPEEATHVFFITDGRTNPVDQIEVFKAWVEAQGGELARVICVVNCQLVEKNPSLVAWYDACVHFSDVVLLNRREGVENKWISDFQTHYKKQFLPVLFEFVKDGRVKNPLLVLEPQARRVSQVFDEEQDFVFTNAEGEEIDEDEETADDEEIEAAPAEDPYLERRAGGQRVKQIPDVTKFLDQPAPDAS